MVVPIGEHDWPAIGERMDRLILLNAGLVVFLFLPRFRLGHAEVRTLSVVFAGLFVMGIVGSVQRILYAKKIIELGGTEKMHVQSRDVFANNE